MENKRNDTPNYGARRALAVTLAGMVLAGWLGMRSRNRADDPPPPVGPLPAGSVTLLTSPTKARTLETVAGLFTAAYPCSEVRVRAMESRDGLQAILSGAETPDLFSPSEAEMTTSLNAAWKARTGRALIDTASPAADAAVAQTCLVFLTTASRVDRLRPLLTGPTPWRALASVRAGLDGRPRVSIANPLTSGSGLAALGAIDREARAAGRPLRAFLDDLTPGLVDDGAARAGSSQLVDAYLAELTRQGGVSDRDAIVCYESAALAAIVAHPELPLRVLYPQTSPALLHRVSVLRRPGVPAERIALAEGFVRFLKTPAVQRVFADEGLRPRFAPDTRRLPEASGFRRDARLATSEPYERLMEAAATWRRWSEER